MVTERGEARRQLGSDLHDSVGHQLVSLTRHVDQAMRTLAKNPALTNTRLAEIHQQLVVLTQHVRTLAHQLFPPELELFGLVGALRERALTHPTLRIQINASDNLPPLPAEIEAAVYYIALEALTNIEKHAQTNRCIVRLTMISDAVRSSQSVLELCICDDGVGIPAHTLSGLGLLSMQARAVEVGGTCHIETNAGSGTIVRTRIPYF